MTYIIKVNSKISGFIADPPLNIRSFFHSAFVIKFAYCVLDGQNV